MKKILCILWAFVLCLAIAAVASADSYSTTALDAVQEKESESNIKYNILLKHWAYDPNYIDDIDANFPAFYGGAYIDEEKNLVMQVTKFNDEIKGYFANLINLENVVFAEVKFSIYDLKAAHDKIYSKMMTKSSDEKIASITAVGISYQDNAVNLYIDSTKKGEEALKFANSVKKVVTSFENVNLILDGKFKPCAAVDPGTPISDRSVGFWAYGSNGLGIVTAPHSSITQGQIISINSVEFGTAGTPYYGGNLDAVLITRTNTSFTPSRYVVGHGFSLYSRSQTVLAVGSTAYLSGKRNPSSYGSVLDIHLNTSYGVTNCVLTNAPCTQGDSGGIVAGGGNSSMRYVAGIITGEQNKKGVYVKSGYIISGLGIEIY